VSSDEPSAARSASRLLKRRDKVYKISGSQAMA
jgi:hypothetical protein